MIIIPNNTAFFDKCPGPVEVAASPKPMFTVHFPLDGPGLTPFRVRPRAGPQIFKSSFLCREEEIPGPSPDLTLILQ